MTDIALDTSNDLIIENGQIPLLRTEEEFTKQRLDIHLRTISGDWFLDINFGLPRELLFAKGTQGLLDSEILSIIGNTEGIQRILTFSSDLNVRTRVYTVNFTAVTDSGEIIAIEGLETT